MDLVPLDFSERVAAAWKCCEDGRLGCDCVIPVLSACNWSFPKATNATFIIIPDARGEWRYNFRLESGTDMTMSELLKHPDFKNLQVDSIDIDGIHAADRMKPVSVVGMEKLLNFVSFLANEPEVSLNSQNASEFSSREGALLLSWLEQRCFSEINFWNYHSAFNRVLEKQFSRRIPTNICVHSFIHVKNFMRDKQFFAEQLRSGQITRFRANYIMFSSDVMEEIIESFLRSPSAKKVDIYANFVDSTEGRLMEMEKGGLCRRVDGKFIFENPFHRLQVSQPDVSNALYASAWRCVTA